MEQKFCQSCGMPINNASTKGTNQDGSINDDFCKFCFHDGHFTNDCSMEEMIQHCSEYLNEFNAGSSSPITKEQAITQMRAYFPSLKRWKKTETKDSHNEAINRVTDYINIHLNETLDIRTLANIANISPFHFHRIFKSFTGESLGEYVQRIRLDTIAHKLLNTRMSLSEIAEQTSYNDKYALSKAFKKYFGMSPHSFRLSKATLKDPPKKAIFTLTEMEPTIKSIDNLSIIYLSVNQTDRTIESYFKAWKELESVVSRYEIKGQFLSFSFDDCLITNPDKCRYYIAHTVSKDIKPSGKLGTMEVEGGLYAIFRHVGKYDDLGNVYYNIYNNWIEKSVYSPRDAYSFEMYMTPPDKYEENLPVTDIYIPITQKD